MSAERQPVTIRRRDVVKLIIGEGQRGFWRVKPKNLADAQRATRYERHLNWVKEGLDEALTNFLRYGTGQPSEEDIAAMDLYVPRKPLGLPRWADEIWEAVK
jgi:hypothetical protein